LWSSNVSTSAVAMLASVLSGILVILGWAVKFGYRNIRKISLLCYQFASIFHC
jgi:hypothetical protein